MDNKKDFTENMNRLAKVKAKEIVEIKKDDLFSRSILELDEKSHKEDNIEFWYARELQKILGYASWDKFLNVIEKAKTACFTSGFNVADHWLSHMGKSISGKGKIEEIQDYKLTRYACYLIAQNGDSSKYQIAIAQSYFAVQTRKQEIIEQKMAEYERIASRVKLSESEKELSALAFEKGVDSKGFAMIRSKGDAALFGGHNTSQMKQKFGIKDNKSLADCLPTVTLKAKDLAIEMTNYKLKKDKEIYGETPISNEHYSNNTNVRKALTDSGIYPEDLPPAEDVKKIQRKIQKEVKQIATKKTIAIDKK
ncbi:MAG: DNA damage-inducible protein D [Endomicrobium sp.]|jgi:DNA-damage-inducible protein D|nr:DNA damage-inducible protein D [Endomicrobium sp.]